jgi:hypothetical protein
MMCLSLYHLLREALFMRLKIFTSASWTLMILTHRFRKEDLRSMLSVLGKAAGWGSWKKGDLPPSLAGLKKKSIYLGDGTKPGTDFQALMDMHSWKDEPDEVSSRVQGRVSSSLILSKWHTVMCKSLAARDMSACRFILFIIYSSIRSQGYGMASMSPGTPSRCCGFAAFLVDRTKSI